MNDAIQALLEIEAIRQLKYRYFRAVDCHDWPLLASCLAEDCTTWLDSGKYRFNGRDAFVGELRKLLDDPPLLTLHQGHHPEIELLSADRAKGLWYLEDYVISQAQNWLLRGTAYYQDEYVKRDGRWQILSTGYDRVFEAVTSPIPADFRVTANRFNGAR